jgi:uncharacterized membrane protein
MSWYLEIKWLHIVSSTMLFGTGAGIAFFFVRAQRRGDSKIIAAVGRDVVLADMIFTGSAVILQPATGVALAFMAGYKLSTPWLSASILLYVLIGCCWLPVVWLQIRMRDMAIEASTQGLPLPELYQCSGGRRLLGCWSFFI